MDQGILSNFMRVRDYLLDEKTSEFPGVSNVAGKEGSFYGIDEAASGLANGIIELLKKYQ
jgi:hypothetical protein